jgi:nonsense-mediated mRNA decay protein 3
MFCPECGNTDLPLIEGICQNCFLKGFSILKIPESIEVTVCAHCNAKFEEGKWEESELPEEEIIYRSLERSIILDPHVDENKVDIELEILQMRGTIAECYIEAVANVFGEEIIQSFETQVRLKRDVCPTCSKQQSGYYESVVQFRADERELTESEYKESDEIVDKTLANRYYKDKLAYLVQKAKLKEGIDYYIGSYKSGKKIAIAIQEEFGGIIKESPRLISQDKSTGKGLYRIWISIRLPRFKKGDFIRYQDKNSEVLAIDGKRILINDLATQEQIAVKWKEYNNIKYLKSHESIESTTILSKSPTNIQILDPDDFSVVDMAMKDSFEKLTIGQEVKVVKIDNNLYLF